MNLRQARYIVAFVVVALVVFLVSFDIALTEKTADDTSGKETAAEYQQAAKDDLNNAPEEEQIKKTSSESEEVEQNAVKEEKATDSDLAEAKQSEEVPKEADSDDSAKSTDVASAQANKSSSESKSDVLLGTAVVKATSLNVRGGPGTAFDIIDKIQANTTLPALEEQNNWYRVLLPGDKEGWVFSGLVELMAPNTNSSRTAMINVPSLNLRSGPSTEYRILGSGILGEEFKVISSVPGWFNVAIKNTTAWISARHTLLRDGDGGSVDHALAGKTIVIDPGHGGHDPGAVGRNHRLAEKFVNLDTALRVAQLLENTGANVVLTRSSDVFITLSNRVNIAHANNADIFVSIHANAHNNRAIGGIETYYNTSFQRQDSYRLANMLQQELVSELGLRDIGVKTAGFRVIRSTQIPSALVELAFLSNPGEEELLNQSSFRQRAAEAVYRGIIRYFQ